MKKSIQISTNLHNMVLFGESIHDFNNSCLTFGENKIQIVKRLWGHQFQEEAVKEYADLDKQFCDWADKELDNGNEVIYSCSW